MLLISIVRDSILMPRVIRSKTNCFSRIVGSVRHIIRILMRIVRCLESI